MITPHRQTRRRFLTAFLSVCALLFGLVAASAKSAEPVAASIGKESAWTGEAVPLIVTLYSPGPFQGTASFDFPELPRTAFLSMGSPVVASEDVDGETRLTQRYEFRIYTQQTGQVVVPPFQVRFQGKQSFVGDAVPMQGRTPELMFLSKRPPGTEKLGVVVAASKLETEQSWTPSNLSTVHAGDVIERTISRRVAGTTAMMLPPIVATAPDGVQVYPSDPIVEDKITRGQLSATRIDAVKYQFQRPGRYELPDVSFTWWDPDVAELRSATSNGQTIDVLALAGTTEPTAAEEISTEKPSGDVVIWIFVVALTGLVLVVVVRPLAAKWISVRDAPETIAARAVDSACRSNDARAAYAAILHWRRLTAHDDTAANLGGRFEQELDRLASDLFAGSGDTDAWTGEPLRSAFTKVRHQHAGQNRKRKPTQLPALNPRD